jgi:hypothetical protein
LHVPAWQTSAPLLQAVPSARFVPAQIVPEQTSPPVHSLPSLQAALVRHAQVPPALVQV